MTDHDEDEDDEFHEAWAQYRADHPEVLASWGQQNDRWPPGHPNRGGLS